MKKEEILGRAIKHIDIKKFNSIPIVDAFGDMAFQARNLAKASQIYNDMLSEENWVMS